MIWNQAPEQITGTQSRRRIGSAGRYSKDANSDIGCAEIWCADKNLDWRCPIRLITEEEKHLAIEDIHYVFRLWDLSYHRDILS